MDNLTRLQYLDAMGIDVWIARKNVTAELAIEAEQGFVAQVGSEEEPRVASEFQIEDTWQNLRSEVEGCKQCNLCETRTQTVFGTGQESAEWMVIGEAPGQSEDQQGEPFVGKAGQLLTEMLRAMGLLREAVFITNILKCRPPNNRDPSAEEVAACNDFLQRQIAWVKPKIILAVGRIAAQNLLKTDQSLSQLRGTVHHLGDTPLIVIYHPAYLLRVLLEKRKAWQDLQLAMVTFQNLKR